MEWDTLWTEIKLCNHHKNCNIKHLVVVSLHVLHTIQGKFVLGIHIKKEKCVVHTVHCWVQAIDLSCHSVTPLKLSSPKPCLSNINQDICDITFVMTAHKDWEMKRFLWQRPSVTHKTNKTKTEQWGKTREMIGTSSFETLRCRLSYSHSSPLLSVMTCPYRFHRPQISWAVADLGNPSENHKPS